MVAWMEFLPTLIRGLKVTLELTLGASLLAVPVALLAGLGRLSSATVLRLPSVCYIEIFRGTSTLVQLFWFYFVLPLFGISMGAMTVGILVLGLNAGAYGAVIVHGAVLAVPKGQVEAAQALNMAPAQTMCRIVLPQAIPAMLPPAGNLLIETLKNTALVSLITITDLTFSAQILRAETLRSGEIFGLVLLMYFGVSLLITAGVHQLERIYGRGQGRGANDGV